MIRSENEAIKILIITGSVRENNYSTMVAKLIADELSKFETVENEIIDPRELRLPFPGQKLENNSVDFLQGKVKEATAVVLVTPEYNGTYSSILKLIIENLGFPSVMAGKPVTLVGLASGSIGAIKSLEHLRSTSAHVGAIVLPKVASIPTVEKCFEKNGNCTNEKVERRIRLAAKNLIQFIHDHIQDIPSMEQIARQNSIH